MASHLNVDVLGELPLVPGVSEGSDKGVPYMLAEKGADDGENVGGKEWRDGLFSVAEKLWKMLA